MGRGRLYLTLHCHHQNDFCVKMGGDVSHFNVSLLVRDKVTRQCKQTTTSEEKGEPKWNRTQVLLLTLTNALPLGQNRPIKPVHRVQVTAIYKRGIVHKHDMARGW